MLKWFFLLVFSGLMVAELWLVITLGVWLGVGWTLAWMVGSFLLGLVLLRIEGVMVLMQIRRQLLAEVIPGRELLDMVFIALGGVLLILPGFLTDLLGLVFLFPPFRWALTGATRAVLRRMVVFSVAEEEQEQDGEGELEVIDVTPAKPGEG